jgi:hypothetical protein
MMDVTAHLYPSCDTVGLMRDLWFIQRCFFVFESSDMTPCRWVSDYRRTLRREALAQRHSHNARTPESSDTCVRSVPRLAIIIIIIIINCNWVVTRWQWLFYMYTKYEIGY